VPLLRVLLRSVSGLEKIASLEISDKLEASRLELSPYGYSGWILCEIGDRSLANVRRLRSIVEAHIVLHEEDYSRLFSIDRFADRTIELVPAYAPNARKISVSAYSVRGMPSQREIQGAFSKRIVDRLNAECDFRNYDTALRVTLLKTVAVATINLKIQPGNIPRAFITHPTPLLPPIAYCMVKLASPQGGELLLDPMCGCGTIPLIAALEWSFLKIRGVDIKEEYVTCARKNAEVLGLQNKTEFALGDVDELDSKGLEADIIAVNPPYGIVLPTQRDVDKLYEILFKKASLILSRKGRIAIVTPYPRVVEREASNQMFTVESVHRIREGDLPRVIHLMRRA
jgi:23S rRNA G2445 N2-methylase RlmL